MIMSSTNARDSMSVNSQSITFGKRHRGSESLGTTANVKRLEAVVVNLKGCYTNRLVKQLVIHVASNLQFR